MKKTTRIIIWLLTLTALLSVLATGVVAEETPDNQEKNNIYASQRINDLNERYDGHYAKKFDGDPNKIESSTYKAIQVYINEITELKTDERVHTEDLTAEFDLSYNKGIAAGILSWIYYSHYELCEVEEIKAVYEYQLDVIDSKTAEESAFFTVSEGSAPVYDCYTLMFKSIYAYKIKALAAEGDSEAVKTIISAAWLTIDDSCSYDEIGSNGEDGQNYKDYYEKTRTNVINQRNRDLVNGEMSSIFGKLFPEEDYATSERLINFRNQLGKKTAITDMNQLMADTLSGLLVSLKEEGKSFRNEYLTELSTAVGDAVKAENSAEEPKIAQFKGIFDRYSLSIYVADKKDELAEYVKAEKTENNYTNDRATLLDGIATEYTSDGGILDTAESVQDADTELERAKTRCEWFEIYCDTADSVNSYAGDQTDVLNKVKEKYEATDKAVAEGARDEGATALDRLCDDVSVMDSYVTDAEVVEFCHNHKDIIGKESVTAGDLAAISAAIADAEQLTPEAEVLLADTLTALGEKYKAATIDKIDSHRKEDGISTLRNGAADKIAALVEALTAKDGNGSFDLSGLKSEADSLAARSATAKELFDAYVSEYLSAKGRMFAEDAESTVNAAIDQIIANEDGTHAKTAEDAVVELQRYAALEKIYGAAEGNEKVDGVQGSLDNAKNDIKNCKDKAAIDSYTAEAVADILELIRLDRIGNSKEALDDLTQKLTAEVEGYKYLTAEEKQSYLDQIKKIKEEAVAALEGAADAEAVESEYESFKDKLEKLGDDAAKKENSSCFADAKEKLNASYGNKDDYSIENYADILELIQEYEKKLDAAKSVSEYESLREEGIAKITAIEDLLETAKRLGKERFDAEYTTLMERENCYSDAKLAELTEIYGHSLAELDNFTKISDVAALNALVDERITLMRGVPLDTLYTEDESFADNEDPTLPEGYDPVEDGYFGSVSSESGLFSDMELTMERVEKGDIADRIKKAAKNKLVVLSDGQTAGKDILKLLKNCEIVAAVEIGFGGRVPTDGKSYTVSMLLPEGVELSEVFGVVFVSDDGVVEFYDASVGTAKIDFTTTHFSKYYVVSKGAVNLVPWMICLGIILLCELAVLCILLYRKRKREGEETESAYALMVPFALAVRYKPAGGLYILIGMAVCAVALAGAIGYLTYLEIRDAKRRAAALKEASKEEAVGELIEDRELVVVSGKTSVVEKKRGGALTDIPEKAIVKSDGTYLEPVSTITVSEADLLLTDSEVEELRDDEYVDNEIYFGTKKASVNIDTISQIFESGDVVTLNSLKEKGLVGKNVGYVKILARGILDKELTVVAQDFSAAASKMIVLTGGKAVFTHSSVEMKGKKRK